MEAHFESFWTEVLCSLASGRLHVPSSANSKPRFVKLADQRSPYREFVVLHFVHPGLVPYFDSLYCSNVSVFPKLQKQWDLLKNLLQCWNTVPLRKKKKKHQQKQHDLPETTWPSSSTTSKCPHQLVGALTADNFIEGASEGYERLLPKNGKPASLPRKTTPSPCQTTRN